MTHFRPEGERIVVRLNRAEMPAHLRWQGTWHRVQHASTPYRVDVGWWEEQRIWRDYFQVLTTSGWLAIIFQDLCDGDWFLQRRYN